MTSGQTTALAALGGAAAGGLGGATIATGGKKVLFALGGVVLGAMAGGIVATLVQQAAPASTAAPVGAGRLPPHIAAIM